MEYLSKDDLIKDFHKQRKASKGQWLYFDAILDGNTIKIKSFDTWVQRAEFNNLATSGAMDIKVRQLDSWLNYQIDTTLRVNNERLTFSQA